MRRRSAVLALFSVLGLAAAPVAAQTKLLRFPDIRGDEVVFCYAGDLWLAPSAGGEARRLTAHEGIELFPKFSPDGKWIAFTGQYDGDEQVYVIPREGGIPKQLTWYPARGPLPSRWGSDNQVYGWTKDSKHVLFRSMRGHWSMADTQLYTVDLEGGLPVALPMPTSGGGDFSPGERQIVYSPLARDFRTWKRYQGGWAQDLYIYDLSTAKTTPVAHSPRTERDPMWIGNQIYFASDRDGTLNLYAYDIESKKVEQLTKSTTWDLRWPSKGENGEIVYEGGGELHVFDTKTRADKKIDITVPNDGVAMRPSRVSAASNIEDVAISPKGERVLICARGDVFSAPAEKGPTRNLTHSSDAHDRAAVWSPDGAKIAYVSDKSGEEEIWLVSQDGSGAPEQLTKDSQVRRLGLEWSPDGKRIAFSDQTGKLQTVDVATKEVVDVAKDKSGQVGDYVWSADGAWLAFSLGGESGFRAIWIFGAEKKELHRVTSEMFNETEPAWDPAGNYLYYLSDREYAPQISGAEWNFATSRTTCIFALALRKDVKHPFPPESDEVKVAGSDDKAKSDEAKKDEPKKEEPKKEDAKKDDAKKDEKPKPVQIDFDGIESRVARVPLEAGNYNGLAANKENLFYGKSGAFYYGRESDVKPSLWAFNLKDRKPSMIAEGVGGGRLSSDGQKLVVRAGGEIAIYDASPKGKDSKKVVPTAGLMVDRVPKQEWIQIFNEVWRRYRDYFYVPNMHGYDWMALRRQYGQLLEFVAHRSDLNYVMGEMVAELNIGHAYIAGGDWIEPERARVALPGCRFELDKASGRYKISKIFAGQNEEERYRSPLTEIGVDARVGDFLLAIDGENVDQHENPYRLLRNKADRPVEFTLNEKPEETGARKVVFRPVSSETSLMYLDWVEGNRARVDKLSNGRIGYMHLPDMGADGLREFVKWFYGQVRKDGFIIDDRGNGGGNVSQMVIERLRRKLLATEYSRNSEYPGTYPGVVFNGPMACLLNEDSASDGDIFPWMFREAKLGPLIGKRSWGGVVGISGHGPLIDGGQVSVPEFGHADAEGHWAVEGHGVDPDIVVENDPAAVIAGHDPQLERAVEEVTKALATTKHGLPPRPEAPVKTKP